MTFEYQNILKQADKLTFNKNIFAIYPIAKLKTLETLSCDQLASLLRHLCGC